MLQVIWDTRGYFFWLLVVSLVCWVLERMAPWRRQQKAFRNQIGQDFFWLIFNGHYAGLLLAHVGSWFLQQTNELLGAWHVPPPDTIKLVAGYPLWLQFFTVLTLKDFLEWCIHNLLHRVPWLWEFHKLHHSIEELDWIGNFRFHWMESVVYQSLTYLPLVMLGVEGNVLLALAVFGTLIGHLNHSNLKISWGPLRYLINSPRMHVWHHDIILRGGHGKNFAVIFSLWDWLFGTAYWPTDREQPERLGFEGMERFPKGFLARLVYPLRWGKNT